MNMQTEMEMLTERKAMASEVVLMAPSISNIAG